MRKWLRTVWVAGGLCFTLWIWLGFQTSGDLPSPRATATAETPRKGLIFLPGGMVAPEAYRPLMERLRGKGFAAEIEPLPYRCACTETQKRELFDRIEARMRANPNVRWAIGGHSRGAMLAARFLHERPQSAVQAAVLIATTHPRDFDLSQWDKKILKIYGSEDGVASQADIERNRHLLPPTATLHRIDGANHVQFGYYRHQLFGGSPSISREQQQEAAANAISELLSKL